jgi:hypothetical protein
MAPCPCQGKPDPFRTIWRIPGASRDLYIVRAQDQRGCEEPLNPGVAYPLLDRWAADRSARAELLQLYTALRAPSLGSAVPDAVVQQSVKPRLHEAFQRGELLLIRVRPVSGLGAGDVDALIAPVQASAAPPPPPRQTNKTWVEIALVDMEGNPVGGKHYLIKTPSGVVEEGYLDSTGRARLNNIDPGSCTISFPDLDREAWERAS